MKRLVFFENVTSAHRPLVAWYLARGYRVFVFDFTYKLKFMTWLRKLLLTGRVERIYFHPASRAEGLAMDAAEWFYPQASGHRLIRRLEALYGREETGPVFKYALVQSLARYFYTRLYLQRTIEKESFASRITFVPESYGFWDPLLFEWCRDRLEPLGGVYIPWLPRLLSAAGREWIKVTRYLPYYFGSGMFLVLGWFARTFATDARGKASQHYKVVYGIGTKFQTKFSGARRFDFLLDHQKLTKVNTGFLIERSLEGEWIERERQAGYQMIKQSEYCTAWGILRYPPQTIPVGLAARALLEGIRRIQAPEWIHQAATLGLWVLSKETNLFERIRFEHYVYTNQYGIPPRWRNVLVRRAGGRSWWFAYSNGGGFMYQADQAFASGSDFGDCVRFWAYENMDHFVSPCSQLIEYHRRHHQRVRWYHEVGNLWSEQILQVAKTLNRDALRHQWFGTLAQGRKVVAWFDTSFVEAPHSPSTFTEAIQWYRDILRLTQEHEDLLMVIKPSKDEAYYVDPGPHQLWASPRLGQQLMQVWDHLKAHPRIRFLRHTEDPTQVLLASDLTVTFCFSSVSAEALGAGKRGIWYEPGERWKDTLWGKEPLLTAHGYTQLQGLVEKLLFKMSDEEYRGFLQNTVRGLVENFLDGKGLSRFRMLLAGEALEGVPQANETVSTLTDPILR